MHRWRKRLGLVCAIIMAACCTAKGEFYDDFDDSQLDANWTFINPLGDAVMSLGGSTLSIRATLSKHSGSLGGRGSQICQTWTSSSHSPTRGASSRAKRGTLSCAQSQKGLFSGLTMHFLAHHRVVGR